MIRRLRKWYLCRLYGICPVHNQLRPHVGYGGRTWGMCPVCCDENAGKNHQRNTSYEEGRENARNVIDRDWRVARSGE